MLDISGLTVICTADILKGMAKVTMSIPDDLLKAFDNYVETHQYERSEFVRRLMRSVVYPKDIVPEDIPKYNGGNQINIAKADTGATPLIEIREVQEELKKIDELRFCKLHWEPVKGKMFPCRLITWEDENGTPVVDKQWACPDCLAKYESMGRGRVVYL